MSYVHSNPIAAPRALRLPEMTSVRGALGAVVLWLAFPVTIVASMLFGERGNHIGIHVMLGLGTLLAASAAFDFETPAWVKWLGFLPTAVLGVVFSLQALTEITQSAALRSVAYDLLGQDLEGWLLDGFIIWALAAVLLVSRGNTRIFGLVAVGLTIAMELYRYSVLAMGGPMNDLPGAWKLVVLLAFAWLFVQSSRAPQAPKNSALHGAELAL